MKSAPLRSDALDSICSGTGILSQQGHLCLQELTYEPKEAPNVHLIYKATITGAWTTFEPNIVETLSAHHILGPDFLEK